MKLYQYDHCPFCVRADMVANYKEVAHEKVHLSNDDEVSCFALIGAKQVPILQFDDGTTLGESLDIARTFDDIGSLAKPIRPQGDIQAILSCFDKVRLHINCLLFPRDIALGLPEFATQSARDYFQSKKEQIIQRPFSQALEETAQHKTAVELMLTELPPLPSPADQADTLGWDDVLIYPTLRNLTMVKDLAMPASVVAYVEAVAAITGTRTYFDRAI